MPALFKDPTQCCGCSACADICPKGAISMIRRDGFSYPEINKALCIECGLCTSVCTFGQEKNTQSNCIRAYACKAEEPVRMQSSSGGIFTALSDHVLELGGVIYGAAFDSSMVLRHARATTPQKRDAMRGSKYIQSNTAGIFRQVKADLKEGRQVLFTGTPCQVAALKAFLKKDHANLLLVDIICHGVPSPEIWEQFVTYLNEKYHAQVTDYSFRNKQVSWRRYSATVKLSDGRVIPENDHTGSFIELFRYDVCMRPSCTVCRYASHHREGDITIGDFWGIENVLPELDDNKGVSSIMVNSPKAEAFLEQIKDRLTLAECTQEQIAAGQLNLSKPSRPSNKAVPFQADWKVLPFRKLLRKYTRVGIKRRVIDFIKSLMNR